MNIKIIILFLYIFITKVRCFIELNALGYNFDGENQIYTKIINDFNQYSANKKLGVKIKINLLTNLNSTVSVSSYESTIENLLHKNKTNYDIYFYDNIYTPTIGKYLLDLKEYIHDDHHIDMFDPKIISESCMYKDKIVGLPITLIYSLLYSNVKYLEKYDKRVPKTWDELIKTSQDILEKERVLYNNTNLIAYNGLFNDGEHAFSSIYEFIYSFRKTPDSPFPDLTSEEAVEALKMMKKIKETFSLEDEFRSNDGFSIDKLIDGSALFIRYLIFPDPMLHLLPYKLSRMPGNVEGVSATILSGFNVGIIKYIKDENKDMAIEAVKYITSKEVLRKFLMRREVIPGILSLYDDEEVCKEADCELFKSFHPIGRPSNLTNNFNEYSKNFRDYIYEYLYDDEDPLVVLKKAKDLTKIYNISIKTGDTVIGVVYFVIIIILSTIMFISLIFVFMEKYNPFFGFVSPDLWILIVFGSIIILFVSPTYIGDVKPLKCHLEIFLLSIGFTLTFIPIFYRLLINFPEENSISKWVSRKKYLFIFIFVALDLILNGFLLFNKFAIKDINIINGQNFQICENKNILNKFLLFINVTIKMIVLLALLLLIFIEWNIQITMYDVRFIVITIYVNILSIVLYIIFKTLKIKNYISYFMICSTILIIFSVTNYIFMYGFRIIVAFLKKQETKMDFINKVNDNFVNSISMNSKIMSTQRESDDYDNSQKSYNTVNNSEKTMGRSRIFSKIITYHYTTENATSFRSQKADEINTFQTSHKSTMYN